MAAANLAELPGWARELLERAPVGRLGYLDDRDRPRVLPITFAVAGDDLWTAIDQKPKARRADEIARLRYLRRHPQAALCVDHYEDDWSRLAWVQATGSVEVFERGDADASAVREALARLASKYPTYADDPPRGPLIRLAPERVLCWRASDD